MESRMKATGAGAPEGFRCSRREERCWPGTPWLKGVEIRNRGGSRIYLIEVVLTWQRLFPPEEPVLWTTDGGGVRFLTGPEARRAGSGTLEPGLARRITARRPLWSPGGAYLRVDVLHEADVALDVEVAPLAAAPWEVELHRLTRALERAWSRMTSPGVAVLGACVSVAAAVVAVGAMVLTLR